MPIYFSGNCVVCCVSFLKCAGCPECIDAELGIQHDDNDELDEDEDDKDDVIWPGSKSWDDTRAGNDDAWPQSLLGCILF